MLKLLVAEVMVMVRAAISGLSEARGCDHLEASVLIDTSRRDKLALRPQKDFLVSGTPGKSNTLRNQLLSEAHSARRRFHQQQAQLGHSLRFLHEKNRPDIFPILLGHPALFACRNEVLDKVCHDLGYKSLEALVVTIFLRIKQSVAPHHPAHIAGAVRPEYERRCAVGARIQNRLDRLHGVQKVSLLRRRELTQDLSNLFLRPGVQRLEHLTPFPGEREQSLTRVFGRLCFVDETVLLEAG
jgi:hypothetical protein